MFRSPEATQGVSETRVDTTSRPTFRRPEITVPIGVGMHLLSTSMTLVTLERRGPIAIITLDRPDIRNAFDHQMAQALGAELAEVEDDPELRVAILAATVTEPRPVFCAGHDLRTIEDERNGCARAETETGGFGGLTQLARTKPLIAAVDGLATSGGLELVLSCDLVVATRRSSFELAEVRWGLIAARRVVPASVGDRPGHRDGHDPDRTTDRCGARVRPRLVSTLTDSDVMSAAIGRAELIAAHPATGITASMFVATQAFSQSEDGLWAANNTAIDMIMHSDDLTAGLASFAINGAPRPTDN